MIQMNEGLEDLLIKENPSLPNRILNHWDNLDGSIERGYAGESLWKWDELPFVIDSRYTDYARMLCSVGINGSVLNNVNTQPKILSTDYISKIASLASVFRSWGIQTYVSVNFGSPVSLGGLKTADPLDQSVIEWWEEKIAEIYASVPKAPVSTHPLVPPRSIRLASSGHFGGNSFFSLLGFVFT